MKVIKFMWNVVYRVIPAQSYDKKILKNGFEIKLTDAPSLLVQKIFLETFYNKRKK